MFPYFTAKAVELEDEFLTGYDLEVLTTIFDHFCQHGMSLFVCFSLFTHDQVTEGIWTYVHLRH